jgi:1-acyl-sn-glycerol-3-phosphate acyltransferase
MLRSIVFNVVWVVNLAVYMIINIPLFLTVMSAEQRHEVPKRWARQNYWLHRVIVGTRIDVQGRENIPHGPAIIASKHQSNWDFYVINDLLPNSAFILKDELMRIPIFGRFVAGLNHIPIRRADKGHAMRRMIARAKKEVAQDRQIVVFAEGTRTIPTAEPAYRYGTTRMYLELGVPVVPVALNSGLYWERKSFMRHPGKIRIRFMEPIPPGLDADTFTERMITAIESGMDTINSEALTDKHVPPLALEVAKLPPAKERIARS